MTDEKSTDSDNPDSDSGTEPAGTTTDSKKDNASALAKADSASRTLQEALDRANPLRTLGVLDDTVESFLRQGDELAALARFRDPIDSIAATQHDTDAVLTGFGRHEDVLGRALDDAARLARIEDDALRLSLGPLRELETAAFAPSLRAMAAEHDSLRAMAAEAATRFRLPEINETTRLLAEVQSVSEMARRGLSGYNDSIQSAMDAIREPWINTQNALRSVSAYSELQSMAARLAECSPYEAVVVDHLRHNLGDWRDRTVLPKGIGDDLVLRSGFYVEQGFDPGLTEFPNAVFEETLDRGALRERVPLLSVAGQVALPTPADADETGLVRTNWAHDRLMRLELHVRAFVDERMTASVGKDWIRHRVPATLREKWKEKQEKAKQAGEAPRALIHYADFSDYAVIIERSDNWNEVFKPVFRRSADIRESWQRLFPIRIATMHARLISQDDELLLVVETKRILKAIGVLR